MGAAPGDDVDECSDAEEGEGEDLEGDTGHHEAIADFLTVLVGHGCGCDAASDRLDHQRYQVARDKYPGVQGRSDARVFGTEAERYVLKDEVDGCRVECRAEDEAADLDLETDGVEGVGVEHDSANVADALVNGAEKHGQEVCPCLVADARVELEGGRHLFGVRMAISKMNGHIQGG